MCVVIYVQIPAPMDWGVAAWPEIPLVNDTRSGVGSDLRAGWAKISQMGAATLTSVKSKKAPMGTSSADKAVRQLITQGRLGKAVDLLISLSEEDGTFSDRALVNFVLYNCMRRKDWTRALAVVDAPKIDVDIVGFTMAIKACGHAKRWREVR